MSARELAEAFTPTPDEAGWARTKTTTDQHFLALVVLLKCYQRLGYFPKLSPFRRWWSTASAASWSWLKPSRPVYESDRTLWRHRDFVRGAVGREVHAG
ncbi:transposase [Pseudonocardia sp. Ae717_Ps2]|nr:transposase [Pseudonocardia sp. Ae717_Ps2]